MFKVDIKLILDVLKELRGDAGGNVEMIYALDYHGAKRE